jgi:hypothetical protein
MPNPAAVTTKNPFDEMASGLGAPPQWLNNLPSNTWGLLSVRNAKGNFARSVGGAATFAIGQAVLSGFGSSYEAGHAFIAGNGDRFGQMQLNAQNQVSGNTVGGFLNNMSYGYAEKADVAMGGVDTMGQVQYARNAYQNNLAYGIQNQNTQMGLNSARANVFASSGNWSDQAKANSLQLNNDKITNSMQAEEVRRNTANYRRNAQSDLDAVGTPEDVKALRRAEIKRYDADLASGGGIDANRQRMDAAAEELNRNRNSENFRNRTGELSSNSYSASAFANSGIDDIASGLSSIDARHAAGLSAAANDPDLLQSRQGIKNEEVKSFWRNVGVQRATVDSQLTGWGSGGWGKSYYSAGGNAGFGVVMSGVGNIARLNATKGIASGLTGQDEANRIQGINDEIYDTEQGIRGTARGMIGSRFGAEMGALSAGFIFRDAPMSASITNIRSGAKQDALNDPSNSALYQARGIAEEAGARKQEGRRRYAFNDSSNAIQDTTDSINWTLQGKGINAALTNIGSNIIAQIHQVDPTMPIAEQTKRIQSLRGLGAKQIEQLLMGGHGVDQQNGIYYGNTRGSGGDGTILGQVQGSIANADNNNFKNASANDVVNTSGPEGNLNAGMSQLSGAINTLTQWLQNNGLAAVAN